MDTGEKNYTILAVTADFAEANRTGKDLNTVVGDRLYEEHMLARKEHAETLHKEENKSKTGGFIWIIITSILFLVAFIFTSVWLSSGGSKSTSPTLVTYQIVQQQVGAPHQRALNDWGNTVIYTLQRSLIVNNVHVQSQGGNQMITVTFVGSQSYPTADAAMAAASTIPNQVGTTVVLPLNSSITLIYKSTDNVLTLAQATFPPATTTTSTGKSASYGGLALLFWILFLISLLVTLHVTRK